MAEHPYPTPHIDAVPEDFAKTVLMPGDPLRAQFIAQTYLEGARLVNNVRGIQGYTGSYHGVPVSVMASGMGIPSIGIYSYELYHFFGVENILRVGSAGAISTHVHVYDLVLGMGACTNSAYASQFCLPGDFAPIADWTLLQTAARLAGEMGLTAHIGNLLSSDCFYNDDASALGKWAKMGVLATEMEAAALYLNAARAGKRAPAICTISDHCVLEENTTAEQRQTTFTDMMELALEVAVCMDGKDRA